MIFSFAVAAVMLLSPGIEPGKGPVLEWLVRRAETIIIMDDGSVSGTMTVVVTVNVKPHVPVITPGGRKKGNIPPRLEGGDAPRVWHGDWIGPPPPPLPKVDNPSTIGPPAPPIDRGYLPPI